MEVLDELHNFLNPGLNKENMFPHHLSSKRQMEVCSSCHEIIQEKDFTERIFAQKYDMFRY